VRYKLFGRSGLRVSELCLGTFGFGFNSRTLNIDADLGSDATESKAIFEAFANAGGNFIDTAHVYGDGSGSSERLVGEFIRTDRDHFVISSKYTQSFGNDLSKAGNSRKNMRRCVEESLARLGTDHIDLYWLHAWDFSTPMEEILRGFDDLVSSGKVTYIAASNVEAWRLSSANMLAELRGWAPFIGIQIQYNLAERSAERDLLLMAKELDLGIAAWSPLDGGTLTGKYNEEMSKGSGRWATLGIGISEHKRAIVRVLSEVAHEVGCTAGQAALAWLRQQKRFTNAVIPILGARKVSQIKENLGCVDVVLSSEQFRRLDEATVIDMGYLNRFLTVRGPLGARDFSFAGQFDRVDNHRDSAGAR
jgi:aryl-alcohol dehydrogenase-like predicted oxidoreductase